VKPVKDIMIAGGSRMSYYLAKMLLETGVDVKILERDAASCDILCQKLPDATIIHGDGADKELLLEEGVDTVDAFAALTGSDEENIFMSLYARSKARMKTITKVNKSSFQEIISGLDLDTIVYPKAVTAEYIIRYVRAMANSMGSNVEALHRLAGDKVEALSFVVNAHAPVIDVPLMKLNLKPGVLVAAILRGSRLIIPRGNDRMQVGDTVVIVTTILGLQDISDILKKK
jgi:trk system potassium uptake protein TrkA